MPPPFRPDSPGVTIVGSRSRNDFTDGPDGLTAGPGRWIQGRSSSRGNHRFPIPARDGLPPDGAGSAVLANTGTARAQLSASDEERLQILSEPDAVKKKLEKDRNRAPYEFFKSQVAPFDVLPFVKPHHWSTVTLDMRANEEDYDGFLQTEPCMLPGMPLQVVYRRDSRLIKEQRRSLSQQVLLTRIPKEWTLDLVRPGAATGRKLAGKPLGTRAEPDADPRAEQGLDQPVRPWGRMSATIPTGVERDNTRDLERLRYYRLVLPMDAEKPPLSSHPLTWTHDQPRRLGRPSSRYPLRGAAAGPP